MKLLPTNPVAAVVVFAMALVLSFAIGTLARAGGPGTPLKPPPAPSIPGPVIDEPFPKVLIADVVNGVCTWPNAQILAAERITLVCVQYGANAPALWQAQVGSPLLRSQLLDTGTAIDDGRTRTGVTRVRWAAFDLRNDSDHAHALDAVAVRVFSP